MAAGAVISLLLLADTPAIRAQTAGNAWCSGVANYWQKSQREGRKTLNVSQASYVPYSGKIETRPMDLLRIA
jgi:hypothetical protein